MKICKASVQLKSFYSHSFEDFTISKRELKKLRGIEREKQVIEKSY